MTDMNIRVEALVKRVTEKSRPMMSKVKGWQLESQRVASQNALDAIAWVKSAADRAEQKIHAWEATQPSAAETDSAPATTPPRTGDGQSLVS